MGNSRLRLLAAALFTLGCLSGYPAAELICNRSVAKDPEPVKKPVPAKPAPAPAPAKPAAPPPKAKPATRKGSAHKSVAHKPAVPPKPVVPPIAPLVRDWEKFPAIVQRHTSGDIAAVGDVHGDYQRLAKLLAVAKLIAEAPEKPEQVRWTGSQTVLVCTGDLIDKGDHALDVISCFRTLQKQAAEAGGEVIVTMGNHEAEFLAHPLNDKKGEKFLTELNREKITPRDVAEGKDRLAVGTFLRTLPLAARIDDWFFAHACSTQGKKIDTLDQRLRERISKAGFGVHELLGEYGLLEARLSPNPWWERDKDKPEESEARLRTYAEALSIKHFVMGHQPETVRFADGSKRKAGEMFQKYDGLIFLIDVGMSHVINRSEGAILLIHRGSDGELAAALDAKQIRSPLWHSPSAVEKKSESEPREAAE